jgi:hypothetical protein
VALFLQPWKTLVPESGMAADATPTAAPMRTSADSAAVIATRRRVQAIRADVVVPMA